MANHKSAIKAKKRQDFFNKINKVEKSKIRTFTTKVLTAIESGVENTKIIKLVSEAQSVIMKAAQKKVIKSNTAARKVASLARQAKTASTKKA